MNTLSTALRNDDSGFVLSSELVLVGSIVVLGGLAGLAGVRDAVTAEMADVGQALSNMDQSYYYQGMRSRGGSGRCKAWTAGSAYLDETHKDKYPEVDFTFQNDPVCSVPQAVCGPVVPPPPPMLDIPGACAPVECAPPVLLPAPNCPPDICPPGTHSQELPYPGAYSSGNAGAVIESPGYYGIVPGMRDAPPSLKEVVDAYGYHARYGYAGPRPIIPDPPIRPANPPTSVPFVW